MSRNIKIIISVIAAILVVYFVPFIVVENGTYRAPFGSWNTSDGDTISFTSLRSAYALNKDANNALHSYEEVKCYGNTYYYDEVNDVSYTDITSNVGIVNTVVYNHVSGNACSGWTTDDEVAWPFGSIEEVDLTITLDEMNENNWLYIEDGVAMNMPIYNDFSNMCKQNVLSYMRVLVEQDGNREVFDIQLLEDGKFKVLHRTDDVSETIYDRFSEIDVDGHRTVVVYENSSKDAEPITLFTLN